MVIAPTTCEGLWWVIITKCLLAPCLAYNKHGELLSNLFLLKAPSVHPCLPYLQGISSKVNLLFCSCSWHPHPTYSIHSFLSYTFLSLIYYSVYLKSQISSLCIITTHLKAQHWIHLCKHRGWYGVWYVMEISPRNYCLELCKQLKLMPWKVH